MNINLKLYIPIKNSTDTLTVNSNLLLNPFYVTENEVLSTYFDNHSKVQEEQVREMIFKNSLQADLIVGKKMNNFPSAEVFALKRQLTLCLTIASFGYKFNQDYLTSLSRTKVLAEFTVTTNSNNNPQFVMGTIKSAEQCVQDIKDTLSLFSGSFVNSFVKGSLNGLNNNFTDRLWHHFNLPVKSTETYAADKKPFNGRYYKNGSYRR